MDALRSRRRFLANVGQGTLISTIGPGLAIKLGLAPSGWAEESGENLNFGDQESLVRFMQDTPVEQLQAGLHKKITSGVSLQRLVSAGALANARTFAGEDYIGYHTLMALGPALNMARSLPKKEQALPVFKVLYRNTAQIQRQGGHDGEKLHTVGGGKEEACAAKILRAVKNKKREVAERLLTSMVEQDLDSAFNALLVSVQESTDVHRTVLPYRAWELIDVVGKEHASTLLRQSLRYCVNAERSRSPKWDAQGKVLVSLLDEHRLLEKEPGTKNVNDALLESLSETVFSGSPNEAASIVAAVLGEGFKPTEVGEAISLAANQLVLRDHGRIPEWEIPGKVVGSVHGDSIGVHASDSANAWRNLASVSRGGNVYACLILGAWQVAKDRTNRGGDFLNWNPVPGGRFIKGIKETSPGELITQLSEAVRAKLQSRAAAVVHQYGVLGHSPEPVFSALRSFAVSEDGALHAEKYFQTVWDDFHATRPAFRWRHLVALARVTASEYGYPAPGQAEARALLGV